MRCINSVYMIKQAQNHLNHTLEDSKNKGSTDILKFFNTRCFPKHCILADM